MAKGFDYKQPKKVSKRQKAYFKLIGALLECPSGQELKVLRAKQHLIDAGFVKTMVLVAMLLKEEGELDRADFLMNIAANLAGEQGSGSVRPINQLTNNNFDWDDEVVDFICDLVAQIGASQDETEVYPFLEANLDKLDDKLIRYLCLLGEYIKSVVDPEKFAEFYEFIKTNDPSNLTPDFGPLEPMLMAVLLPYFNDMMLEFPKGNRATNIEISIVGHQIILPVFTALPEEWARYQSNLATAYMNRISGDRRSNIEKAIACYRKALEVVNPESSPALWGDLQNNLAVTYSERLEGERAQNIEQAIALANEVLLVCTRDAFPKQWSDSQANLGKFYLERVSGNPA
jgi:tetratricopeptide (TPR) repeat protein